MAYKLRGELWFNSGINSKNAYFMSNGSFFLDNPVTIDQASGFISLDHGNGVSLIFYVNTTGSNVEQAFFGTKTSSGCEHGATGVIEIDTPSRGIFLYRVIGGDAVYNASTSLIRFSLYALPPSVP